MVNEYVSTKYQKYLFSGSKKKGLGWEWEGKGDFGDKSFILNQFHQQSKPKLYVQLPVTHSLLI